MTRWIAARLHHSLARVALLWFPLLLAACSGEPAGDPAVWRDAEQLSRPGQLPSTGTGPTQRRALNVPRRNVQALTAAALFDWAERTYPALFPPSAPMKTWDRYTYRYYAGSGNYLAVAGDSVYALGGFTQQQILRVGTLEDFHCDVLPADCVPPALSLVPSSLSGTYLRGSAPVFPVVATATDLAAFTGDTLFVYVVDSQHVLSSGISLRSLGNGQFRAEVQPAASLAPGRYQGTLLVQLCHDAACADEYAGSPLRMPYDFHVVQTLLEARAARWEPQVVYQGSAPPDNAIVVTATGSGPGNGNDLAWSASANAPWLRVNTASGQGTANITVSYLTATLAQGRYDSIVELTSADGQRVQVPLSIDVQPPSTFWVSTQPPEFSAVNGHSIEGRWLTFNNQVRNTVDWTARPSAPWIAVSPASGRGTDANVLVTVQQAGLAAGTYRGEVLLSAPGVLDRSVPVTLHLDQATLSAAVPGQPASASAPTLTFGGATGREATPLALQFQLNTGNQSWPWSLTGLPAWLSASVNQGRLDETGVRIEFTPSIAALPPGGATAQVSLNAQVNGDVVTLPVTMVFKTPPRRLLPSQWGVGLASTTTGATLTRALRIDDNQGQDLAWSAKSDAGWLKVTPSGRTGVERALVLTADPAAAPPGSLSRAKVTVSSGTTGVQAAEIAVQLWRSAGDAVAQTRLTLAQPGEALASFAADSVRPYFYVALFPGNEIAVYNAHTGTKVGSLPSAGAWITEMVVSPDGGRLYAVNYSGEQMRVYDLATMKAQATWPLAPAPVKDGSLHHLLVLRPNGVELVLLDNGHAFTPSGQYLGKTGVSGVLAASPDGRQLMAGDRGSGANVHRWALDHSGREGDPPILRKQLDSRYDAALSGRERMVFNPEGTRVFNDACAQFDAATLTAAPAVTGLPGYAVTVAMTADGRLLCARAPASYTDASADLRVLRASDLAPLMAYRIAPVNVYNPPVMYDLALTPDGLVAGTLVQGPTLVLQGIPP